MDHKGAIRRQTYGRVVKAFERSKGTDSEGNEVMVGIVEGYLATWDVDRINDRFVKGAFADSIAELRDRKRYLRLKRNHYNLIGGFDPESLREDDIGLYGVAEINLAVQEGGEAYMLAKQGVLADFSVGVWMRLEDIETVDGISNVKRAELWECSLVDEPMNPRAVATMVRGVTPVDDLPQSMADKDYEWDADAAVGRIREMTGSTEEPSEDYRSAFLFFDEDNTGDFDSYRLPVCDVVDGEKRVVPRAVFTAAAILDGAKGGVELGDDRDAVIATVEALYKRMDMDSPFEKGVWGTELFALPKSLAGYIIRHKRLSSRAVKALTALVASAKDDPIDSAESEGATELITMLRGTTQRQTDEAIDALIATVKGAWQ